MKKRMFGKAVTVITAMAMSGVLLAGCGSTEADTQPEAEAEQAEETATEPVSESTGETAEAPAELPAAPYFTKGVYANYSEELENPDLTYFYVFSTDTYGYTADGANNGIGVPFDVVSQADGRVTLSFGGADESSEETLVITAVDDIGAVHGYFEDVPERPMVFELLSGADVDTFSAENYVNGPEESVYHDANGWSVRYNADLFEITPKGPETFIVYTGESAGTNMITVTYTVESGAEEAIKKLGESWGDNVTYTQGPFPGADDVTGYWAMLPPAEGGSGLYETAMGRDYMDGALIFDLTGHMSGDEELDMATSDSLAAVIDSLTWD